MQIDIDIIIPLLVAIFAAMPGILAYFNQRRTVEVNEDGVRTDAANKIAETAIQLLEPLNAKIEEQKAHMAKQDELIKELENKIKELMQKVEALEKENKRKDQEKEQLKDWAERLCLQVKAWGATPVPMIVEKK
ncbi:MAG: hypothetical protein HPY87_08845 [Fervidobacterium sp.]|uniref:hypothetical protein n=1 Tax=Fervidobacterium sp. TaxID=1871331 RepID=UPI0025BFA988|nr:hypothetical protein [Fervidobacterium sp.]NPU89967.1 hypothetical protein [Fervidobacterium sp.]